MPRQMSVNIIRPSQRLQEQIAGMVANHEDYIVEPDGVDGRVHAVVNFFPDGVWLCLHHDECNLNNYTRLQRLA